MNFKPNTVLVLGAGASKDFGLPLGMELKQHIEGELNIRFNEFGSRLETGSPIMVDAFRILAQRQDTRADINPYLHASREIASAMPLCTSIDDYLEKHQGLGLYESCGKLAIAKCILESERTSILYSRRRESSEIQPSSISLSWMTSFMQTATRGVPRSDINGAFQNLIVVNFNYDRCFEIFAYNWLKTTYRLTDAEAIDVVENIDIVRPYGSIGAIPWRIGVNGVEFGSDVTGEKLIRMSENIRTYSESVSNNLMSSSAINRIYQSRCIVFLGFAFHRQNMKFFDLLEDSPPFSRHIFACRYGIPDPRWEVIKNRIGSALNITSDMLYTYTSKGDCKEFWEEYSDNIAA